MTPTYEQLQAEVAFFHLHMNDENGEIIKKLLSQNAVQRAALEKVRMKYGNFKVTLVKEGEPVVATTIGQDCRLEEVISQSSNEPLSVVRGMMEALKPFQNGKTFSFDMGYFSKAREALTKAKELFGS